MTEKSGSYAQVAKGSNEVFNVILMNSDFEMDGYSFIAIPENVRCQPGNYFNAKDGFFYEDKEFTTLSGADSTILVAGSPADIGDTGA